MPELRLQGGPLDGLGLHYVTEGRGPAVVLVHGLGGFAESWRHNIATLARRATVYALDLPGFGRSAKPRAEYSLTFFATALSAFLDALGLGQVSLVGHSLGGAIVLMFALARPQRVDRLALVGGVVLGCSYRLPMPCRVLMARGLGEALALCACAPVIRAALARCFYQPSRDEVAFLMEFAAEARITWAARAAYLATLRALNDDLERRGDDFQRALTGLDVPVLAIHGRQDSVVPAGHCTELARALPRADVRWIDACGHFPQIEHAATVNEWLADFLVGRPARR